MRGLLTEERSQRLEEMKINISKNKKTRNQEKNRCIGSGMQAIEEKCEFLNLPRSAVVLLSLLG